MGYQSSRLAPSRRVLAASPSLKKLRADPQHYVINAVWNWRPDLATQRVSQKARLGGARRLLWWVHDRPTNHPTRLHSAKQLIDYQAVPVEPRGGLARKRRHSMFSLFRSAFGTKRGSKPEQCRRFSKPESTQLIVWAFLMSSAPCSCPLVPSRCGHAALRNNAPRLDCNRFRQ